MGVAFGAFFDLLIRDLENIAQKEVIIAGIFLPVLALISVGFMVRFSNFLHESLRLSSPEHSPIIIGVVYAIAFILPYIIRSLIDVFHGRLVKAYA